MGRGGRNFANFRDHPIQKNGIFETPLYNKMAFSRPPYTKKCHFRDPPIQQNAIFETPLYKKLAFLRTPYTKKYHLPPPSPFLNGIALSVYS